MTPAIAACTCGPGKAVPRWVPSRRACCGARWRLLLVALAGPRRPQLAAALVSGSPRLACLSLTVVEPLCCRTDCVGSAPSALLPPRCHQDCCRLNRLLNPCPPPLPGCALQEARTAAARHAGELMKEADAAFLRQKQGEETPEFKQVGAVRGGRWHADLAGRGTSQKRCQIGRMKQVHRPKSCPAPLGPALLACPCSSSPPLRL